MKQIISKEGLGKMLNMCMVSFFIFLFITILSTGMSLDGLARRMVVRISLGTACLSASLCYVIFLITEKSSLKERYQSVPLFGIFTTLATLSFGIVITEALKIPLIFPIINSPDRAEGINYFLLLLAPFFIAYCIIFAIIIKKMVKDN